MIKGNKVIVLIVYLIFAVYFLNHPFQLVEMPEFISSIDNWVIFVGGILLVFGAINYLRIGRY